MEEQNIKSRNNITKSEGVVENSSEKKAVIFNLRPLKIFQKFAISQYKVFCFLQIQKITTF